MADRPLGDFIKHNTKGFTLIELLIVVVIIGILAAIAIPKFAATKEKAYLATMKTDLKNLATAEEGYASDHAGAYMPAKTGVDSVYEGYAPSSGVTVDITLAESGSGWAATAKHTSTDMKCGIFVGSGSAPNAAVTHEGEPSCWATSEETP
jgi:prepilin-type N-terminal cleavage/methylation domain-containing protein